MPFSVIKKENFAFYPRKKETAHKKNCSRSRDQRIGIAG
jgi:hypothetical protein